MRAVDKRVVENAAGGASDPPGASSAPCSGPSRTRIARRCAVSHGHPWRLLRAALAGSQIGAKRWWEPVRRRDVPACADRDATLRWTRADTREGGGLCLRPSPTGAEPAAYGHRRQNRNDLSGRHRQVVGLEPSNS